MKAECSWGFGMDVLLSLNGSIMILHEDIEMEGFLHGTAKEGSLDLTIKEAEELGNQLLNAAQEARQLEEGYKNQ